MSKIDINICAIFKVISKHYIPFSLANTIEVIKRYATRFASMNYHLILLDTIKTITSFIVNSQRRKWHVITLV